MGRTGYRTSPVQICKIPCYWSSGFRRAGLR
ncbi:hypothetical protein V3C99_015622 [Haemonchus contortus]